MKRQKRRTDFTLPGARDKLDGRLCEECGDYYLPNGRRQKKCPRCQGDSKTVYLDFVEKFRQLSETIKKHLDAQVIHLDPQAYERGERKVINGNGAPIIQDSQAISLDRVETIRG